MERFKALSYLFGAYYHQDWDLDAGSDDSLEPARKFVQDESTRARWQAHVELLELLAIKQTDEELAAIVVDELGCDFNPRYSGGLMRDWLQVVLLVLQSSK